MISLAALAVAPLPQPSPSPSPRRAAAAPPAGQDHARPETAPGGPAQGPIPKPPAGRAFSPAEAECRARIEALLARPVAFLASQL